ncbi:MAG: oligosaccharide flippase family protein, partial [Phycisphaeraceae bacterium]
MGGVAVGYVNMAAVMLAGLVLTPFLLGRLGQHDYGLWLVGLQILAYLALMDFGVVTLLARATAYATGRAGGIDKAADLPDVIGQTVRLVLWQVPLVAAVAGGVWLFMPAEWSPLQAPVGLMLIGFVVMFPVRALRAVLEGLQDLTFLGQIQLGTWLAGILVTVAAIVGGRGLLSLALGWVVSQILAGACWAYRLRQRFPGIFPARLPALSAAAARRQLGQGFWVIVAQVAHVLLAGTDVLIIGILAGPAAVVPFVCTGKLISVLTNQPHLLMQAAGPALSEMRMGEPKARLFQVSSALTQAMLMASGAVACAVLAVNQGFVTWWVGADQYAGLPLTVLLVLVMLLRHWNTTT